MYGLILSDGTKLSQHITPSLKQLNLLHIIDQYITHRVCLPRGLIFTAVIRTEITITCKLFKSAEGLLLWIIHVWV